jgi:hypothetical protein
MDKPVLAEIIFKTLETDRLAGSAKNMSEKEMTFIEHIIELRNRLKVVAISFVAVLIF